MAEMLIPSGYPITRDFDANELGDVVNVAHKFVGTVLEAPGSNPSRFFFVKDVSGFGRGPFCTAKASITVQPMREVYSHIPVSWRRMYKWVKLDAAQKLLGE